MQININGDAERLIRERLAAGEFQTAEELIAAMARAWVAAKGESLPQLSPSTDIRQLAVEQGVQPFDPASPLPDFWPSDESTDEFLSFLREIRRDTSTAGKQY